MRAAVGVYAVDVGVTIAVITTPDPIISIARCRIGALGKVSWEIISGHVVLWEHCDLPENVEVEVLEVVVEVEVLVEVGDLVVRQLQAELTALGLPPQFDRYVGMAAGFVFTAVV